MVSCDVCGEPTDEGFTVTFGSPNQPNCLSPFCRECGTAFFQFLVDRRNQIIEEGNRAVRAMISWFDVPVEGNEPVEASNCTPGVMAMQRRAVFALDEDEAERP